MKHLFFKLGFLFIILGLILIQDSKLQPPQVLTPEITTSTPSATYPVQLFKVSRVIDGDTIEIESGWKVRYIGIDTPESKECFGQKATEKNKELVLGKEIRLEKDVSETDRYGRLLRHVYVGEIFVNDYLIREGFARASSYPPDIKYQEQLRQAEKEARENNLGLWSECKTKNKN